MFDDINIIKNELQNIILGKSGSSESQLVKTIQAHLINSPKSGKNAEKKQLSRAEEERTLIQFANANNLWIPDHKTGVYITEGAEQKVYFQPGTDYVIKTADAIFYQLWVDYFNNLLVHNYLFPDTAYTLLGFSFKKDILSSVLKQPFINSTATTNLEQVKEFLLANGFTHKKNNDYTHNKLGIILEDLHDENVLTNNGILYFVDTVIYLTEQFYR